MDSFVKIENTELSNSKLVTRFMRGLAMQCPKKPKYKDTWDPAPILEKIAEWGEPETLSYEKLSKRTLLLFLLSTAGRMQTAYLLNREDFSWDPEGVSIDFSERLKTNASGTLSIRFDYLREDIPKILRNLVKFCKPAAACLQRQGIQPHVPAF